MSKITWALRVLWLLIASVLVVAILVGVIRGTFYTGPAPAPAPVLDAPSGPRGAP